jgi:hypothetical protein
VSGGAERCSTVKCGRSTVQQGLVEDTAELQTIEVSPVRLQHVYS